MTASASLALAMPKSAVVMGSFRAESLAIA